jgi:hypothetical protein
LHGILVDAIFKEGFIQERDGASRPRLCVTERIVRPSLSHRRLAPLGSYAAFFLYLVTKNHLQTQIASNLRRVLTCFFAAVTVHHFDNNGMRE